MRGCERRYVSINQKKPGRRDCVEREEKRTRQKKGRGGKAQSIDLNAMISS